MKMKGSTGKKREKKDDSLFGLLSAYKSQVTFLRVLESDSENKVVLQLSDNPGKWPSLNEGKWESYYQLRRLELDIDKLSTKYVFPEHLVKILGPLLGIRVPAENVGIENNIINGGVLSLHFPRKYKKKVLQGVKKLVTMTPQKKYEILEKCIMDTQEE